MTTYADILPTWNHPTGFDSADNFNGQVPQGYCLYSINRDSSILERSNFDAILEQLGGEGELVDVVRHRHWACDWIEYIIVSKDAPAQLLDTCVDIVRALDAYSILSEDKYSEAQYQAIWTYWDNLDMRDRIALCAQCGESIFTARWRWVPDSVSEYLMDVIY